MPETTQGAYRDRRSAVGIEECNGVRESGSVAVIVVSQSPPLFGSTHCAALIFEYRQADRCHGIHRCQERFRIRWTNCSSTSPEREFDSREDSVPSWLAERRRREEADLSERPRPRSLESGAARRTRGHETTAQSRRRTTIIRKSYGGGKGGSEVVLIEIKGGGHTWPGGLSKVRFLGKTTMTSLPTTLCGNSSRNTPCDN